MENSTGEMPFWTSEAVLADCLILAGCEPVPQSPASGDIPMRLPCINRYDEDILFTHGGGKKDASGNVIKRSRFADMPIFEAATVAWKEGLKGHVSFGVKLTPRCTELIRAYRDQCEQIEKRDDSAFALQLEITASVKAGAMLEDEGILRQACITLKTRKDFVTLWQRVVPLLSDRMKGKVKRFDTSVVSDGKSVAAQAVTKPGFRTIFLNASEKMRKALKF